MKNVLVGPLVAFAMLISTPSSADVLGVAYGQVLQVAPNYLGGGCRIEIYSEHQSTIDFPATNKFDKFCAGLHAADFVSIPVSGRVGAIVNGFPTMTFWATGTPFILPPLP